MFQFTLNSSLRGYVELQPRRWRSKHNELLLRSRMRVCEGSNEAETHAEHAHFPGSRASTLERPRHPDGLGDNIEW